MDIEVLADIWEIEQKILSELNWENWVELEGFLLDGKPIYENPFSGLIYSHNGYEVNSCDALRLEFKND